MSKPDFIDNLDGNTMEAALRDLLDRGRGSAQTDDGLAPIDRARIASAYFTLGGFSRIAQGISALSSVRLLLGADPTPEIESWQRPLDKTEKTFNQTRVLEKLDALKHALQEERDHQDFSRENSASQEQLRKALKKGNIEARLYQRDFLHAKAYIFTPAEALAGDECGGIIAGSSNLTYSGLVLNRELNLGRYSAATVRKANDWFDALWEEAEVFDLSSLLNEIPEIRTPFEIFLRVLWELYGDEINEEKQPDGSLSLTSFQKHGVARALRLLEKTGGAIVADEVGLGKTFIAADILQRYRERRQHSLLICPASLRDSTWKDFATQFEIFLEVISFEQLARDEQLKDQAYRPKANKKHLRRSIDEYQLVIIDEAHNYRNPDTPTRAAALRAFLQGRRKDVLMLTATPVNNSLWDLHALISYFLKQDSALADRGVLSIKQHFEDAAREDPDNLSPDVLYPVIDATTVKRTRHFIKKYYHGDQIPDRDGNLHPIVFPEPRAITVRYKLNELKHGLFDRIEQCLDPDGANRILFARYMYEAYLKEAGAEGEKEVSEKRSATATSTGLLRSGLLKRYESSTGAFRISVKKLIDQHKKFLEALEKGFVIKTKFFKELANRDDESFDELLEDSENSDPADRYDTLRLRTDVEGDLEKFHGLYSSLEGISPKQDPKLQALARTLKEIAVQAEEEGISREDRMDKGKVLIFSFYADSVRWIQKYLRDAVRENPELACYRNRIDIVVSSGEGKVDDKASVAAKFAPKTAGTGRDRDEISILISTDVLAEGVNLQQARHIINYDMPWNPMRLVQRHGRIDRINSEHRRVFLRTIFPVDRLNELLKLEERINQKIAMAAASVGVVSPLETVGGGERVFSETRGEIDKLLKENSSLYERGGTVASAQSGEEYRQALRKAIESGSGEIERMPWKVGSGMRRGRERGIFFCARVGKRPYLRFVHADEDWNPLYKSDESDESGGNRRVSIDRELGRCLRIIECEEKEKTVLDKRVVSGAIYDFWELARKDIHNSWMRETDPANLHLSIRSLNEKVAEFIRKNTPHGVPQDRIDKALNIVESPWSRRDEQRLRGWYEGGKEDPNISNQQLSASLVEEIIESGLEAPKIPDPLPLIEPDKIYLIAWLAITPEDIDKSADT